MLKIYQQTLNSKVKFAGIGLHSGKSSEVTILPGEKIKALFLEGLI